MARVPHLLVLLAVPSALSCERSSDGPRHAQPPPPQYAPQYAPPPPAPTAAVPPAPAPPPAPSVDPVRAWAGWLGQVLGTGPQSPSPPGGKGEAAPTPPPSPFPMPTSIPSSWFPWAMPSAPGAAPASSQVPPSPEPPPGTGAPTISPRARDLADAINRHRAENGLPKLPISPSLTLVAETHARDLPTNPMPPQCNGHSWSDRGSWTPCCYTADHAQSACMWKKPQEIAGLDVTGYEISIGQPGVTTGLPLDASRALDLWKSSPPHHDVILNRGQWRQRKFRSMGAGIVDSHACVWFAEEADPAALKP